MTQKSFHLQLVVTTILITLIFASACSAQAETATLWTTTPAGIQYVDLDEYRCFKTIGDHRTLSCVKR
jgi:hypothetical protein